MVEPLDLAAIEARADAAQPGPWHVGYEDGSGAECGKEGACITALPDIPDALEAGLMPIVMGGDLDGCPAGVLVQRDAVFIAAARADVPALVAEVKRLRGERDRFHEALFNIAHLSRVCGVDDAIAEAREALDGR